MISSPQLSRVDVEKISEVFSNLVMLLYSNDVEKSSFDNCYRSYSYRRTVFELRVEDFIFSDPTLIDC